MSSLEPIQNNSPLVSLQDNNIPNQSLKTANKLINELSYYARVARVTEETLETLAGKIKEVDLKSYQAKQWTTIQKRIHRPESRTGETLMENILSETEKMNKEDASNVINRIADIIKFMPGSITGKMPLPFIFQAVIGKDINKAIDVVKKMPPRGRAPFFKQIINETSKMDKATTMQVMSRLIEIVEGNTKGTSYMEKLRASDLRARDLHAICSQLIIAKDWGYPILCPYAEDRTEPLIGLLKILPENDLDLSTVYSTYLSDLIVLEASKNTVENMSNLIKVCVDIVKQKYDSKTSEVILAEVSKKLLSKDIDSAISVIEAITVPQSEATLEIIGKLVTMTTKTLNFRNSVSQARLAKVEVLVKKATNLQDREKILYYIPGQMFP